MELLRTYEVPDDWKELEKEEESEYSQRLLAVYGPFSVVLYARIRNGKLFTINVEKDFAVFITEFYMRCIGEMDTNEKAFRDLKSLIKLFPSSSKILKLLHSQKKNVKEMMFMKLAIDILEHYHKIIEKPLFTTLQRKVLPLALKFYSTLEEETISEMNNLLNSRIDKSNS